MQVERVRCERPAFDGQVGHAHAELLTVRDGLVLLERLLGGAQPLLRTKEP
jgi:hypothetical protein